MGKNWKFHHMAIVVRDIDRGVEYFQSLGVATFQPEFITDSSTFTDYKVYGKTPTTIDKTRGRFVQIGSLQFELLQPVEGGRIYVEFLKSRGEGVHHVAYTVGDLNMETAKLAEKGIPVISKVTLQNGDCFAYFDTCKIGNIVLELMQLR